MKKLLSILTISTLTASTPAPLLANTPLTRAKRDVSPLTSNSNNGYLPIKKIKGINDKVQSIVFDSKDNIYFGMGKGGAYKLAAGSTTPTKIGGFVSVLIGYLLAVDSKDNIYFGTDNGAYKLAAGSTNVTSISGMSNWVQTVSIDSKDTVYFGTDNGAYKLAAGSTTPTKINGVSGGFVSSVIDNSNNIYFGTNNGVFVLKHGSDTPTKINGISGQINSIALDSTNNVYFGTDNGAYKLVVDPTKINGISGYVISVAIDNNDNVYFGKFDGVFVLKHGSDTPTKINGISGQINSLVINNTNYLYLGTNDGAYVIHSALTSLEWIKQQSRFALVDSTKTQTWTRPDLIAVDGEVNIDIANPNIDKVVFDNVQQPQTSKQWRINVKPETAAKDHNLQVMFTLDGKQYKSEIIVSMQAKIDPIPTPVQQNLSDLIKTTDLENIIDNNNDTIFTAVNQKNGNVIDDFSQITIEKKDDHSATLTAKSDSKSYMGSVDVKYNVVPTTVVDLKIDVTPTSSLATVVKDYLGQIDISNITNPINTFYYASSESVITMVKPTDSSVITGVVYGCDDKWNKTAQSSIIDPTSGIKLDGSQLNTKDGKYVVELSDNLGHTNNVYLQIWKDKKISNYFDTDNGKQFEIWAKANGYDNIRGSSASQLNKLFEESKNWQQIASDSQFATSVADWFKTNGKLSATASLTKEQVVEQLKLQIPSDIKIPAVNTSNYDVNKASFELNQSEFNPNDKVNITVKYNSATSKQFTLQIKDSKTPDNKKGGGSKLWIIGVVVGVLVALGLAYLLFKRFVFDKYFLPKIKKRRHLKLVEQVRKEESEKEEQNNKGREE